MILGDYQCLGEVSFIQRLCLIALRKKASVTIILCIFKVVKVSFCTPLSKFWLLYLRSTGDKSRCQQDLKGHKTWIYQKSDVWLSFYLWNTGLITEFSKSVLRFWSPPHPGNHLEVFRQACFTKRPYNFKLSFCLKRKTFLQNVKKIFENVRDRVQRFISSGLAPKVLCTHPPSVLFVYLLGPSTHPPNCSRKGNRRRKTHIPNLVHSGMPL